MTETDGYSVKLILSTPYHEAFEYRTVKTLKNGSVYLPTPRLSGCTFDGWQDADGNYYDAVSGWDLDADLTLYGTLRKTKGLHIAEFWLDGEVYAYRLFDEETFILRTPDVSPEEGKTASGWRALISSFEEMTAAMIFRIRIFASMPLPATKRERMRSRSS